MDHTSIPNVVVNSLRDTSGLFFFAKGLVDKKHSSCHEERNEQVRVCFGVLSGNSNSNASTFTVPYTSMNTSESESWKFGDLRVLQAAFKVLPVLLLLTPIFPVFLRSGRESCFMSSLILLFCSSSCSSCFSPFSPSCSSFLYLHHIPHRECCTFFPGVERERLSCTTPF